MMLLIDYLLLLSLLSCHADAIIHAAAGHALRYAIFMLASRYFCILIFFHRRAPPCRRRRFAAFRHAAFDFVAAFAFLPMPSSFVIFATLRLMPRLMPSFFRLLPLPLLRYAASLLFRCLAATLLLLFDTLPFASPCFVSAYADAPDSCHVVCGAMPC